jgi:5-methyltetrahydropteroyltriglutamate--homocysteine methyltransferase
MVEATEGLGEHLSPHCGFATSIIGNAISVEDEEHKLRTIVETTERVWG